jgi:site-specific recombinase
VADPQPHESPSGEPPVFEELPPREEFLRIIGAVDAKASPLLRILLSKLRPEAPFEEQLAAVEQLGRFIVAGPAVPGVPGHDALARLELLVVTLERIPAARRRFQATLHSVFSQTRAIKLFGEVGLPNDQGLWAETTDRLAKRFLPEAPQPHELWMLASNVVRKMSELDWLGPAADQLLLRLADAGGDAWNPLRVSIMDAISLIATRVAAIGMSENFRLRAGMTSVRDTPLYHLTRARPSEMPALIEASRKHLDLVRQALEDTGVSIDVVYRIDSIERGLSRIELLLPFVDPDDELEPTYEIRAVIAAVGRGLVGNRSFQQLLADNLRLLARKVIERAGRTGEHYVTSSRREYFDMLKSAAGGGVLTCGTAVLKFLTKWGEFAPFLDGLLSSVVYAGSFIIMQLLGFTLATKQPSMTAAALAGTIRERSGPGRLDELVPLIARIARSQFAAALGNVSAVIVTALAFDFLFAKVTGHSFLGEADSTKTIESFDPIGSGTIFYGFLTGVLLWVSSLFAGWFENWVVYRRLPEAIEHHRWGKRFGRARMAKWARFLERQAAGFGGSVALGVLLAFLPVFGKFFGLPLDVRHITLSTGSLTLSMSSLGVDGVELGVFIKAAIGIGIIGLLNFGVSFTLALIVALRARDVPRGERRTLPGAVLRRFFRRPLEFFYPPKDPPGAQTTSHGHH